MVSPNFSRSADLRVALVGIFAAFGLIVLGIFALLAFDTVISYQVTCTRSDDACVLEQQRLTKTSTATVPLHSLTSSAIELWRGGRGQGQRVLLMLVGGDERHFAAEYEGLNAQEDAAAAEREIDDFIAGSARQVLKLQVRNPVLYTAAWIGGLLCLLLVVGGGMAAVKRATGRESAPI